MKPVIAMPEMGNSLFRKYMKSKYVKAVEKAGGTVVWIDWAQTENTAEIADKYDGLLLPGGADINPSLYGDEKSEKCGESHPQRDALEPLLLKAFLKKEKPVLGICRGSQMMNVVFGGTLHQDIKDISQANHSDFFGRKKGNHTVNIEKGSLLYSIVNTTGLTVNSLHHQAADKVADSLVPVAYSQDGFVEAVECPEYDFCLGVQWHPEHMAATNPVQQKIITAFVQRCR